MKLQRGPARLIEHLKTYCRKQHHCWPSVDRLARELHRDRRTIFRWLASLGPEFIEREQRGQTSAMIHLKPLCFQRNWLSFVTAVTAGVTADVTAVTAVLITERTTSSEEEKTAPAQSAKPPNPEPAWGGRRETYLGRALPAQDAPQTAPRVKVPAEDWQLYQEARNVMPFIGHEKLLEVVAGRKAGDDWGVAAWRIPRKPAASETSLESLREAIQ